jgi:hypothetical protein
MLYIEIVEVYCLLLFHLFRFIRQKLHQAPKNFQNPKNSFNFTPKIMIYDNN